MKMLPNLGRNVMEGMDIETLTAELQELTQASKRAKELQALPAPKPPSPTPSVQGTPGSDSDVRSENGSVSVVSYPGQDDGATSSDLEASTTSWVENMSSDQGSQHLHSPEPSSSGNEPELSQDSLPGSNTPTDLSESIISSSSVSYGDVAVRRVLSLV